MVGFTSSDALTRVVSGPGFRIQPQCSLPVAGVPVSSRVSSKIQQLLNTLKKPKRPPLKEFFVDDLEEVLEGECPNSGTLVCADRAAVTSEDTGKHPSYVGQTQTLWSSCVVGTSASHMTSGSVSTAHS